MKIRLAIRGYLGPNVLFENQVDMEESALEELLPSLAEDHAHAMATHALDMVEIEFLDEPDPLARYFRLGTNPAGMVMPIEINLGEESD